MKTPIVSVIVVAYNAGKSVKRCIDSIVSQSLSDIELVFVDDGSVDDTGSIIEAYAKDDNRIKVVHQKNAGVAAARQTGLDNATGQYSIFVDADDWIEPDMLVSLTDNATETESDIVFCDYIEENENGIFYRQQKPVSAGSSAVLGQMLIQLHGSLCNKLIRRELYTLSGTRFIEGLNFCEDEYIIIRLLSYGCKVGYVEKGLYHYDKNSNGASFTNQWYNRPAEEYELFIQNCAPYFNTPELRQNLDQRIAGIIKKLTHAPDDRYSAGKAFYLRHKASLWRSNLSISRKMYCWLYFNGFRWISQFGNVHLEK